jgi:colanic acid biosynthesis glycosyl transferase WcaI
LLGLADIHLLPQSLSAEDIVLPSKLSSMLASGRPVVATCQQSAEIAVVISTCGLVMPLEDDVNLAEAIVCLVDQADERRVFGAEARKYAERYLARVAKHA